MTITVTVAELDRQLAFLEQEISALRSRPESWAVGKVTKLEALKETTRQVRQALQMGKLSRPDQVALEAVPELKGKHALVLYFTSDADREEFATLIKVELGDRLTKTVSL
jgi:hypothetical protein